MPTSPATGPQLTIALPAWASRYLDTPQTCGSLDDRMRVAIDVARQNVVTDTGGPFGAAVFESESGRLISVGMNLVVASNNAFLHAEVVALMFAQRAVGSYSLRAPGLPSHEIFTSCAPCAMCLGAILWSGVSRLVSAAAREDAMEIGFDEGPVFDASYDYLISHGIVCEAGVLRNEARAVLQEYRARGAPIYNG